jgi:hypothetical protein
VYDQFKSTAQWYKKEYGKMPVIVFDNVNRLAKDNPKMLEILQEGAKDAIVGRKFITVFVSSDGLAPAQLQSKLLIINNKPLVNNLGRSAFSRGSAFRIGDINKAEVFEYLNRSGLNDSIDKKTGLSIYSRVFDLVGGRFQKLDEAVIKMNGGLSFEGIIIGALHRND